MFALKLRDYIYDWYGISAHIATNGIENMRKLGAKETMIALEPPTGQLQHRPYDAFDAFVNGRKIVLGGYDLIFVAPLTADMHPEHVGKYYRFKQIRALIPDATYGNTFFFSEYNLALSPEIQFPIGIGKGRLGLFFTHIPNSKPILKDPYTVMYLNNNDAHIDTCICSFLDVVTKEYDFDFDIVVPPWMSKWIESHPLEDHVKTTVKLQTNTLKLVIRGSKQTITFRADVLPLPHLKMTSLIRHSLPLILLTGDQSFTDALSCCSKTMTVFYQDLPWKKDFYTTAAEVIPAKHMASYKTSCGSLQAVHFKPSYSDFVKDWDFRVLGKPYMDAALLTVIDAEAKEFLKIVNSSRTLKVAKERLAQIT